MKSAMVASACTKVTILTVKDSTPGMDVTKMEYGV